MLVLLAGCGDFGKYPDGQICLDVAYAYAARVYECHEGDPELAARRSTDAFDLLLAQEPCRAEDVEVEQLEATFYQLTGDEVAVAGTPEGPLLLSDAYRCPPVAREVDCALADDVSAAWDAIVAAEPVCARILGDEPPPVDSGTSYAP